MSSLRAVCQTLCKVVSTHKLTESSLSSESFIIMSISQIRKLRLNEIKWFAQD